MLRLAAALIAVLASGCAAGRDDVPEIVVDRSACSHCGMLISELRFAAAYRTDDGETKVFDEIGCLVAAARGTSGTARFWFRDADDGGWIGGGGAVFVSSASIRTPMGGGIVAFRTGVAADAAAGRHNGRVVRSLTDLMSRGGQP